MRRLRYGVIASFAGVLALPSACGLEIGGTGAGPGDASVDTTIDSPAEGGPIESGGGRDVEVPDVASPDADPCPAACTNGTCDGGRCTITCTTAVPCGNTGCPGG